MPEDSDQKRVLVVFGNIPLLGQERGNIQVFSALKERGVDSLFVTNHEYGHLHIQPALEQRGLKWTPANYAGRFSKDKGVKGWLKQIRDILQGSWRLWRIAQRYQPTHIHVANEQFFLCMLPALLLLPIPLTYRLGDKPNQHHWVYRTLWRRVLIPRVDRFVCISSFIKERLLDAGAPEHKTKVIYNYPPERSNDTPDDDVLPAPFDGQTVLYMGQLTRDKGVDLLVEAAIALCRERDDVRFLIAGDYSWKNPFAEGLIEQVEQLGLSGRIQFLGYVHDIPGLLAMSDVHVCPSVWEEPLSNVVVEAKQAGVPSVVFPSGGLPELITDGEDGLICEQKTAAVLKANIQRFLEHPALQQRAGRQAQASLEEMGITKSAFAEAWEEVYESV
jgi:glycosyltransferase involved in cell wall biosynthesis